MQTVATIGAGLSGAVIAHSLAERGHRVVVHDSRDHVAGNCHTERDPETADRFLELIEAGQPVPAFFVEPL